MRTNGTCHRCVAHRFPRQNLEPHTKFGSYAHALKIHSTIY